MVNNCSYGMDFETALKSILKENAGTDTNGLAINIKTYLSPVQTCGYDRKWQELFTNAIQVVNGQRMLNVVLLTLTDLECNNQRDIDTLLNNSFCNTTDGEIALILMVNDPRT